MIWMGVGRLLSSWKNAILRDFVSWGDWTWPLPSMPYCHLMPKYIIIYGGFLHRGTQEWMVQNGTSFTFMILWNGWLGGSPTLGSLGNRHSHITSIFRCSCVTTCGSPQHGRIASQVLRPSYVWLTRCKWSTPEHTWAQWTVGNRVGSLRSKNQPTFRAFFFARTYEFIYI